MLAAAAGCDVTAIHVDHGLRRSSAAEADRAEQLAAAIGVSVPSPSPSPSRPGRNLEARARAARAAVLPGDALTGHTADDQAETVLINLLARRRRAAAWRRCDRVRRSRCSPCAAPRRRALCADLGLAIVDDPTNDDRRFVRNRVRHEVLPLLYDIAQRDVVPLLVRTADVLRDDDDLLDRVRRGDRPHRRARRRRR